MRVHRSVFMRAATGVTAWLLLSSVAWAQPPSPPPSPPALGRWIDLQNATLNLRYRFVDTSDGVVTTNQLQHRETLRARVKFDSRGRYALHLGVFTGVRFTSGWDNTGWGINPAQKNLAFKASYLSAQPLAGVDVEAGGLYIVKGESTEVTTYDDDGYVMGERLRYDVRASPISMKSPSRTPTSPVMRP
jgi:hypothetical protein